MQTYIKYCMKAFGGRALPRHIKGGYSTSPDSLSGLRGKGQRRGEGWEKERGGKREGECKGRRKGGDRRTLSPSFQIFCLRPCHTATSTCGSQLTVLMVQLIPPMCVCVESWCIVGKSLNRFSWFLVKGILQRTDISH